MTVNKRKVESEHSSVIPEYFTLDTCICVVKLSHSGAKLPIIYQQNEGQQKGTWWAWPCFTPLQRYQYGSIKTCSLSTVLPHILASVHLFEHVLMFQGQVHVLLYGTLSNFVKLCTFIWNRNINNEYCQSNVSIHLHWQLCYFINVRNSIFMAEFSIFNKILLNLVIPDEEVVHNFRQGRDFVVRFHLIVMETSCNLPHSIWQPPHQVLKF